MSARTQKQGAEVARELVPGQSAELLKALHILTREGNLNADSLRKLKQVNHLARLLRPAVEDVLSRFGEPVVVDCGAGKSYLGFVLYELFLGPAGKGTLHAVESRPELVQKARELSARLGFGRMAFEEATIAAAAHSSSSRAFAPASPARTFFPRISSFLSECSHPASSVTVTV